MTEAGVMKEPCVEISAEASKLLRTVRDGSGHKRVYVFLDDAGCCDSSNTFVTSSSARLGIRDWVKVLDLEGVAVYGDERFLRTAKGGTLVLDVYPCDAASDSLSLETNYGKRLYAGLGTRP